MKKENITKCDNPEYQKIAEEWLKMLNEKLDPPQGIKKIIKIPVLNATIQFYEK